MHIEVPRLDPVAHPHLGERRTTGREGEHEPGVGLATHHAVVDEVAAFVEQQHVAAAAGTDVGDRGGVDAFERSDGVGAGHDHLAERADVTERYAFAHRPVLGDVIAVVPRPPPTAEAVHLGAEGEVFEMQRRTAERVEVHLGGGLGDAQLTRRGAAGERGGGFTGLLGDEGTQVGHAHRALAGAGAAQRGALDEFDVLEATIPHTLQVFDVDLRAGAHGAAGRAGRQFVCSGSGTDDTYCRFVGHPGEQVAWRPQRRGDNRGTTRLAGAIGGDDGSDPTIGAVETHEIGEVDFDRIRQLDPGGAQLGSSALGENASQHVAVADRVEIG